jgi:hypothetical protein
LAEQQAQLVRALVRQGETPPGFDQERLRLAARSLVNKRLREVGRAWPALARCLGDGFMDRFRRFAEVHPPPAEGGPLVDGWAFARTVPETELDDEARLELFFVERYRSRLPVKVRWLSQGGRLVLGVRLPWLGVQVVTVRLRWP